MPKRLIFFVQYLGSTGFGWQRQAKVDSIQAFIEDAFAKMNQEPVVIHASGRTDAGVHAQQQVVVVDVRDDLTPQQWVKGVNSQLPDGINLSWAAWCPSRFHPRYDCGPKTYVYHFDFGATQNPFRLHTHWWIPQPLDYDAMKELAKYWLGKHDFTAVSSARRDPELPTERTIHQSQFEVDLVSLTATYTVQGDGFLMHQVRIMAGALREIGLGQISLADVRTAHKANNRKLLGKTAPAHGLLLDSIELPELPWEDPWPAKISYDV